jgi:hypothetical protein
MTYLEQKIDFLVKSAKTYCGTAVTDHETRQMIAIEILELTGKIFARRDLDLLKKAGSLLSIFPLLKKDAEGLFLERVQAMEDACLSIQVALRQAQGEGS